MVGRPLIAGSRMSRNRAALDGEREQAAGELVEFIDQAAGKGVLTRGVYDIQGMRADADYLLWAIASTRLVAASDECVASWADPYFLDTS
jgi:chlorite dismutase